MKWIRQGAVFTPWRERIICSQSGLGKTLLEGQFSYRQSWPQGGVSALQAQKSVVAPFLPGRNLYCDNLENPRQAWGGCVSN